MGTCRPDYASNVQERDISVTTPYGRIRGFYVHLFDGPGVPIGDRPGVYHNGKLWRRISTFLGIPYATPPVNEGRFKVTINYYTNTRCTEFIQQKYIKFLLAPKFFYFIATATEKSLEYLGRHRFRPSLSSTRSIRRCFQRCPLHERRLSLPQRFHADSIRPLILQSNQA